MEKFSYGTGKFNVSYLTAPYSLLVKALGNDGTVAERDEYKCEAQWDVATPHGIVEVYDYKIGKCYNGKRGLARHEITDWHVQGDAEAIKDMIAILSRHGERVDN
jgi:hypothetical protein